MREMRHGASHKQRPGSMKNINCHYYGKTRCTHGAILSSRCLKDINGDDYHCVLQKEFKRPASPPPPPRIMSTPPHRIFIPITSNSDESIYADRPWSGSETKKEWLKIGIMIVVLAGILAWALIDFIGPPPEAVPTDYVGSVTNEPD